MPRLRGHHLICLHFFHGEGYSPVFVDNLQTVMELVRSNTIQHCEGPDDICTKCPHLKDGKCRYSETAEEEVLGMDEKALDLLRLHPGKAVSWHTLRKTLPHIFHTWSESYCIACDWKTACEKDDFYKSLIRDLEESP